MPWRDACSYLRDVASSLALLHARRLLHRDVSPRNVRRTSDGRCKLIDFGAMIAFGVPPNVTGTVPCIAPEMLQGAALDQRTDLYSLGALAYRVLTGVDGYAVRELGQLSTAWKRPLRRPRDIAGDIPEPLEDLVLSLLSLDPMKRPQTAAEVIDWLSAIGQLPVDDSPNVARSFLTTSRLCGRDDARASIARSIERAVAGHGATLLVEGMAGCGKSRMLEEAALAGQTHGLTAVRVVARDKHGASYVLARDIVNALRQMLPAQVANAQLERLDWQPHSLRPASAEPPASDANGDASERRARVQQTLTELVCDIARALPLLIAVDDLDRADELSAAFVTALAHRARHLPLVIVASCTEGQRDRYPGASSFAEIASHISLHDLDRRQSAELIESMFGRVPNIDRLSDWAYRTAHGNPKLTVALAEHLLARDVVRYVAGTWVLPSDEIVEDAPPDLIQALAMRVSVLSQAAAALAETLSLRRGGATTELCLQVSTLPTPEVFAALDELVRAGILESAGHEYALAHHELPNVLRRGLTVERSRELHRRWADVLMGQPATDLDLQLEAGWHLIHTEEELRGAELIAHFAPQLIDQGLAMATALPALEAALAIFERHGWSLDVRLRLRATLVLAGYLFDYRLAARYGEETLAALYEASGLACARRLSRFVGMRLGVLLGLLVTALRRIWHPRARRAPPVLSALQYFVRTAMGLMGVRAVALDAQGTAAVLDKVFPLSGSPASTGGPLVHLTCRAISLQMLGREAELEETLRTVLPLARKGRTGAMTQAEHESLLVGLLTVDGINECYRENSQAPERADELAKIGSCLAQATAHRLRLIHALTNGELDRAEEYRRLIDLQGIQGGTTWQVERFAAPIEGMLGGATWSDLGLLKRSLERLRRHVQDMPALLPHLHSLEIAHHFRRGEFDLAAQLGERFVAQHPPRTIVGWGPTYAMAALALVESGQAERARALCERALTFVSPADRAYIIMYGPLEVAHATALAVLGAKPESDAILRSCIERLLECGDHVRLVALHQDQARIARLLKDRTGLKAALANMRREALQTGSPALIVLADRTAELRSHSVYSPLPVPANTQQLTTGSVAGQERAVNQFLQGCHSATERGLQALDMLARYAVSDEAYLFAYDDGTVTTVAALHDRHAPEHLAVRVRELMRHPTQPSAGAFAMLHSDVPDQTGARVGFRVLLLADASAAHGCMGAAVVRDSESVVGELSPAVLADLCGALAEHLRMDQTQRMPSNHEQLQ